MKHLYRILGVTILAYFILGLYALVAFNLKVFNPIAKAIGNYSIEDFYYYILGTSDGQDTSRVVTIVDMTELKSRRDIAKTINDISSLHPKVLGVNIIFEGLKEDSVGDQMLAKAVRDGHCAISYKVYDRFDDAIHSFFIPCDFVTEGFVNMPRSIYDETKRNLSIGRMHHGELQPSFIKLVADKYADTEVMPLEDKEIRINYSPIHFEVVSYTDVLQKKHLIEDRIVLLGATKDNSDMHITPLGKMPGVELMAYGVETMLRQSTAWKAPMWLVVIVSFLITLLVTAIRLSYISFAKKRHPLLRSFMTLQLVIGLLVFVVVAFIVWVGFILFCKYNVSINLAFGIAATACIYNATNLYDTIVELITNKKSS